MIKSELQNLEGHFSLASLIVDWIKQCNKFFEERSWNLIYLKSRSTFRKKNSASQFQETNINFIGLEPDTFFLAILLF